MEMRKFTTKKMKAHLTQEELDRIEHILPQMTYTTTQFIESLVEERIRRAALLAACKKVLKIWSDLQDPEDIDRFMDRMSKHEKEIKSAIEQGESGE